MRLYVFAVPYKITPAASMRPYWRGWRLRRWWVPIGRRERNLMRCEECASVPWLSMSDRGIFMKKATCDCGDRSDGIIVGVMEPPHIGHLGCGRPFSMGAQHDV